MSNQRTTSQNRICNPHELFPWLHSVSRPGKRGNILLSRVNIIVESAKPRSFLHQITASSILLQCLSELALGLHSNTSQKIGRLKMSPSFAMFTAAVEAKLESISACCSVTFRPIDYSQNDASSSCIHVIGRMLGQPSPCGLRPELH